MQPIRAEAIGRGLQRGETSCRRTLPYREKSPFDRSFISFITALFLWPIEQWKKFIKEEVLEKPPLNGTAKVIQDQVLELPPFADMNSEELSQLAVGVVIPSWLANKNEACQVIEAVKSTFGRLASFEKPPSAVYTAMGYELCRVDRADFHCTGPGRIMTLEYDGYLYTASFMQTPLLAWLNNAVKFSMRIELSPDSITE